MSRLDEINEAMLTEFKSAGLEDTPNNRFEFLTGLRDAWKEDPSSSIEKTLYQISLNYELARLALIIHYPDTK